MDLTSSAMNCGACGRACPGGGRCVAGMCQATCGLAGLPCCVGSVCEEGTTCTAGTCSRGPMCLPGQTLCAGTCVDLMSSALHCGVCGRFCASGERCVMGSCQATCGMPGQPCCVGSMCAAGSMCVAGMCAMTPSGVRGGAELVSGGSRISSTNFRMFSTLGQSSQHQGTMSSASFRLQGGLVGTVGGL